MNQRTFLLTVLLLGVWLLIGCGGQTAVSPANPLPTQAAVAVIETAVPPQAAPTDSSEQPAQPIAETVTPGADAPTAGIVKLREISPMLSGIYSPPTLTRIVSAINAWTCNSSARIDRK